ncbi:MAG: molybdate ABC transporter substrate-binding protein [Treponema sp.]|nr:molybdate ABC transporter substrate-binding protein [Treponema sp.]
MRTPLNVFLLGALLLAAQISFVSCSRDATRSELLIGSAASLTNVMQYLAAMYQAENPNVRLDLTFASSGALQNQIMEGAPIDIFFSAAMEQMNNLEARGMIYGESRILLRNSIALIVPVDSQAEITGFMDAASGTAQRIGLGDPQSVPGGTRAREIFTYLGIAEAVYGTGRAVLAHDIRTVLTWVEMGEVDAGVVFLTDAILSERIRVVEIADSAWHDPSINPIGIVEGSPNTEEALRFIDFLFSPEAGVVFARHGFSMY